VILVITDGGFLDWWSLNKFINRLFFLLVIYKFNFHGYANGDLLQCFLWLSKPVFWMDHIKKKLFWI